MANESPPTSPKRVYESIEETAGTFPPWVYDLLTFQRASWNTGPDELDGQFIPLTTVKQRSAQDSKLFVVGLIPPSATVTGRTLDRTATVANIVGVPSDVDVAESTPTGGGGADGSSQALAGSVFSAPGYQIPPASGPNTLGVGAKPGDIGDDMGSPGITYHGAAELYTLFHDAYKQTFGTEPTPTEVLFLVVQSRRETGGAWPNNNPGFIGNSGAKPGTFHANGMDKYGKKNDSAGTTGKYFNTYETPLKGAQAMVGHVYGNPNARAAAASGDVLGYITSLAQTAYYGDDTVNSYYHGTAKSPPEGIYPNLLKATAKEIAKAGGPQWEVGELPAYAPDSCAFKETGAEYRKRVGWSGNGPLPQWAIDKGADPKDGKQVFAARQRFTKFSLYDSSCPMDAPPSGADPNGQAPGWSQTGSGAAAEAQKAQEKEAGRSLGDTFLGALLTATQATYTIALRTAIQQMAQTPPLKLLVNPISFKPTSEKIISDGNFSRNGPIVEHWGEQQDKISASGKLAGFYALDVGSTVNGSAGNSPGITRIARSFSAAYQNFLSLYLIYRNNGTVWIEDFDKAKPKANNLAVVGSVYIYYDNVLYIGSFDSFNVNETDDKPYTLEYDFSFTVRYKFELDRIPDPRETYGNVGLFAKQLEQITPTIPTSTEVAQPKEPSQPTSPEMIALLQKKFAEPVDPAIKSRALFGDSTTTAKSIGLSSEGSPPGEKPQIIPSKLGASRGKK